MRKALPQDRKRALRLVNQGFGGRIRARGPSDDGRHENDSALRHYSCTIKAIILDGDVCLDRWRR